MTLSEIETTLEELVLRHQNLTTELLTTLLVSAGWEEKNVKEAITLFKKGITVKPKSIQTGEKKQEAKPVEEVRPTKGNEKEEITFYQPDGSEEKELHGFTTEAIPPRESSVVTTNGVISAISNIVPEITVTTTKEDAPVKEEQQETSLTKDTEKNRNDDVHNDTRKTDEGNDDTAKTNPKDVPYTNEPIQPQEQKTKPLIISPNTTSLLDVVEPQSLVIHEEETPKRADTKKTEIPEDLPLLPFESSPHVWSFSRYKNVFHGEAPPKKEAETIKVNSIEVQQKDPPKIVLEPKTAPEPTPFVPKEEDTTPEVALEKTPLNRRDESLVVLASIMLLVIILMLGYMYGNGRL